MAKLAEAGPAAVRNPPFDVWYICTDGVAAMKIRIYRASVLKSRPGTCCRHDPQ